MTEAIESSALKKNPELFRILLLKTIDEVIESMSSDITALQNNPDADCFNVFLPEVKKSLEDLINSMWNQSKISEKVSFIQELATKYPPDFVAWRPTTGEIPIVNLRGHYLTDARDRFSYKIRKIQAENNELKKNFYLKKKALQESLQKISEGEELVLKLTEIFENILQKS